MFLVRRVCKVERKDVWQVAKLLRTICDAYESEIEFHEVATEDKIAERN